MTGLSERHGQSHLQGQATEVLSEGPLFAQLFPLDFPRIPRYNGFKE